MKPMEGNQILVTGGFGFVGSELTKTLAPKNEVTVLGSTSNISSLADIRDKITVVNKDIRDETITKHFGDIQYVFHQAARVTLPDSSIKAPRQDADINILGTLTVLDACRKNDVSKVIFASSSAVYGEPVRVPIQEDNPLTPVTPYGLSKKTCEEYIQMYHDNYGLEFAILRPFNIYGENQSPNAVLARFINLIRNKKPIKIFGDGSTTRDYIHVKDVVGANILAGLSPSTGIFNVGTGIETSMNDLVGILKEVCGEFDVKYLPEKSGGLPRSVADMRKTKKILGFESTITLKEGIEMCLASNEFSDINIT
jgi:UDP-glucose 4-epimerase